jgi:hypothetical protein
MATEQTDNRLDYLLLLRQPKTREEVARKVCLLRRTRRGIVALLAETYYHDPALRTAPEEITAQIRELLAS